MGGGEDDTLTADLEAAWEESENPAAVDTVEEVADEQEAAEEPAPVTAPEHWSQADKDVFSALPDQLKPLYLEKAKLLESGWNRKFEEIAHERKAYGELQGLFDQNQLQQIQTAGLTPASYMRRLVDTFAALQTNPQQTLEYLARQHGVSFGRQDDGAERINQIHANEWQSFIRATDKSGSALYPGAHALKVRIGAELQMHPEQPGESTAAALQRAYDAVKWSEPVLREQLLAQRDKEQAIERQRRDNLSKAKRAGTPAPRAKSFPGADIRAPKATLKQELEAVWDQLAS
jgi:hypothetical protein